MKKLLAAMLLFVLGMSVGIVAKDDLKLLVDGHPSKAHVEVDRGQAFVPLSFPVAEGISEWTVSFKYDKSTHKIEANRKSLTAVRKTRGDEECWWCSGTGKCQGDNPIGSGTNTVGQVCAQCNGTAKCWYCNGSGKKGG